MGPAISTGAMGGPTKFCVACGQSVDAICERDYGHRESRGRRKRERSAQIGRGGVSVVTLVAGLLAAAHVQTGPTT